MEKKEPPGYSVSYKTEKGEINKGFDDVDLHTKDEKIPPEKTEVLREKWDSPLEFLLSCIAMSVGLGNVWRFPFTALKNGGGAFLVPYFIVLFLIGRPIYYLELCLGQFSSFGPLKVWGLSPFFKGVGYGSALSTICTMTFYCSIIAVTIFYLFASFYNPLPWSVCGEEMGCQNGTLDANVSLSQLYYTNVVFPQLPSIDSGIGFPNAYLTLCLFIAWTVIFLSLVRGVKSAGKVAYQNLNHLKNNGNIDNIPLIQKVSYFTALFPYFVLILLLVRGVTLDGALDGILYFIRPRWEALLNPDVWFAAVSQCFFSLSTCFGTIIFFSSYNNFSHPVHRDALIISLTDTFTSLLAGITIFSILGSLAKSLDVDISHVAKAGPGLAFVSYPEAIAKFSYFPQFFAVLFFLMLFALGVGSALSLAGSIIAIVSDNYPKIPKWKVTLPVCVFGFMMGLVYITPGGQFILTLVNYYGADFIIYVIAIAEVSAVSWVYGLENICRDIHFMTGKVVGRYWRFCWGFTIPFGLLFILLYSVLKNSELLHQGVPFPQSAIVFGWILSSLGLSFLPLCALHSVWTVRKESGGKLSVIQSFKQALRPADSWGPADPNLRIKWKNFKGD